MAYSRTNWVAHETKATAERMNNIEEGILANEEAAAAGVKYDADQSLTDAQKARARANIGAASASDVGTVPSGSNLQGEVDDLKSELGDTEKCAFSAFPTDSMSGAIANFPDGADNVPVKALSVAIEPVQDLHGYDHPWPAGGGKNLVDMNLTAYVDATSFTLKQGTYTVSTKTPITANTAWYFSAKKSDKSWCTKAELGLDTFNPASASGIYYGGATRSNITFTCPEDNVTFIIGRSNEDGTNPMMVESGSTATSYAPYSNICPISGWTGANVTRTGKNLLDESSFKDLSKWKSDLFPYGSYPTSDSDKGFLLNTKANTTYSISFGFTAETTPANTFLYLCRGQGNISERIAQLTTSVYITNHFTFTTAPGYIYYLKVNVANSGTFIPNIPFAQFELDAVTDYEPFGTTYPISWQSEAGTVYGGTLDVTTGLLTVDRAMVDLGSFTWGRADIAVSGKYRFQTDRFVINAKTVTSDYVAADLLSNRYKAISGASTNTSISGIAYSKGERIIIYDSTLDTVSAADFKTAMSGVQLVYKLATPQTYQLTPTQVALLLGQNNIWADTGNTAVEYRADTKLYIDKKIAALAAAMN